MTSQHLELLTGTYGDELTFKVPSAPRKKLKPSSMTNILYMGRDLFQNADSQFKNFVKKETALAVQCRQQQVGQGQRNQFQPHTVRESGMGVDEVQKREKDQIKLKRDKKENYQKKEEQKLDEDKLEMWQKRRHEEEKQKLLSVKDALHCTELTEHYPIPSTPATKIDLLPVSLEVEETSLDMNFGFLNFDFFAESATVMVFQRGNSNYNIIRSWLVDCQLYPKIFFHEMFHWVRVRIENETGGSPIRFLGEQHSDCTFLNKKDRSFITKVEDRRSKALHNESNCWCVKVDLKESEIKDSFPIKWTAISMEGGLFVLEPFLNHVLSQSDNKYFDNELNAQYNKMLEIVQTHYDAFQVQDAKYEEKLAKTRFPSMMIEKIKATCCEQVFETISSLFSHFRTTHGVRYCSHAVNHCCQKCATNVNNAVDMMYETIFNSLSSATDKGFKVRFGWNNNTNEYGMWTEL